MSRSQRNRIDSPFYLVSVFCSRLLFRITRLSEAHPGNCQPTCLRVRQSSEGAMFPRCVFTPYSLWSPPDTPNLPTGPNPKPTPHPTSLITLICVHQIKHCILRILYYRGPREKRACNTHAHHTEVSCQSNNNKHNITCSASHHRTLAYFHSSRPDHTPQRHITSTAPGATRQGLTQHSTTTTHKTCTTQAWQYRAEISSRTARTQPRFLVPGLQKHGMYAPCPQTSQLLPHTMHAASLPQGDEICKILCLSIRSGVGGLAPWPRSHDDQHSGISLLATLQVEK